MGELIILEGIPGESIIDFVKRMDYARPLRKSVVRGKFNGIWIEVSESNTCENAVDSYWETLQNRPSKRMKSREEIEAAITRAKEQRDETKDPTIMHSCDMVINALEWVLKEE